MKAQCSPRTENRHYSESECESDSNMLTDVSKSFLAPFFMRNTTNEENGKLQLESC